MNTFSRRAFGGMLLAPAAASLFPRLSGQSCAPPPGGTPVAFTPISGLANVTRKAVSTLNTAEVTRLRLAYQRLRALTVSDPNDPRGWMQQANVHCWNCDQSSREIHRTWFFLPWHRAYLYFHERILCKLLNDNSFRLPFWDWDAAANRNLPAIYRPATVSIPNSLFDANRSTTASGGSNMPANFFPANSNPMNAASFTAFGGIATAGGTLENNIHGAVHMWTGSPGSPFLDMGNLSTAARDPVFFAHHSSIDHLWAEWVRRNPLAHANPTAGAFLSRSFLFFDENKKWTSIKVSQVLNSVPLGYSYLPGAGLSQPRPATWTELTFDQSSGEVKLPDDLKAKLAASTLVVKRSLVLDDVQLPHTSGIYNIFVGDPPGTGADQAAAPNYLGYMGVITMEHEHEMKSSLVLNPTTEFLQRAGQGAVLTYAEAGTTQATKLVYSNIYLTEE